MTFLYPMMLWALALPLLLAVAAIFKRHRASQSWQRLVSPEHAAALVVKTPAWRSMLPPVLTLLALTSAILAAARPIHGYTSTEAVASGRNLLIALDISRSMETQDVKPSRLEEARAAAFELVDALPGDKIGLIVFSGEADLVVPLTYDHTALRDALEQVNRNWAGYGGTNFGLVLQKAMQDFTRSAPTGTNALVIFSDGEDTVGSSLEVAQEAREKNLLVITVGVGTSIGDSIPDARGENGLYQDAAGKHVISKLDTAALKRFADATGGDYFTMGSGADLTAFARQAVKKLDTHEESFSGHKVPRDLFAPFAMVSLLLLVAAILLATEWRTVRPAAPLLLLFLVLAAAPAEAAPQSESVRAYEDALAQMGEDTDKAREMFSRALLDEDAGIQAACLYELGNLNTAATFTRLRGLYGQGPEAEAVEDTPEALNAPTQPSPEQLEEIVEELGKDMQPYRDALGIRPGMEPAQTNIRNIEAFIEKLKEEIERLKQQQQQQQNQDNQQQDQQQENQQQQDKNGEGEQNPDEQNQQPEDDQQQQGDNSDQPQQQGQDEQEQNGEQPQQNEPEQNEQQPQDSGEQQQQQQPPPPTPRPQPAAQQEPPMSDKEKAEQRAASILKMHMDEEQGSPIPRANQAVRPPEKDY